MRAFGIEPDADSKDNFKDAGDTWYTGYLAAAKRLGIAKEQATTCLHGKRLPAKRCLRCCIMR